MLTTGFNRRELMAGAGALAARGALPMAVSAGGILLPQIAHAETITVDVGTSFAYTWTIDGKKHVYVLWYLANGDHISFVRHTTSTGASGPICHAVRSHVINGQRHITKYQYCTTEYVGPGSKYKVTFPSTHTHRVLKSRHHSDIDGNGTVDFKPTVAYPSGVTNLTSFDSSSAWGVDFLTYKTYRDSAGTEWVMGAVKSDLDDHATPEWIGFKASGSGRTSIMTFINELKREFDNTKASLGAGVATTVIGAALVGTGARFAYVALTGAAATPAAGIAVATLGVLWVVNAGFQWSIHQKAVADFEYDKRQFEAHVRARTSGKVIYNP